MNHVQKQFAAIFFIAAIAMAALLMIIVLS